MKPELLIIGGGVIGLSIARELHRRGAKNITLVEQGVCGEESSWAAAGMLGPQAEADEDNEMLRFCVRSRADYPAFAAELADETGIDVELDRNGTLYLAFTAAEADRLADRVSWQRTIKLNAELLTGADARREEPFVSPDVIGGALFPDDWQVENRKLLTALRKYADLNGINIIEHKRVVSLLNSGGRVRGIALDDGEIDADLTILATGAWTSLIKLGAFPLPVGVKPIRGQMISLRTAKRLFQRVVYSSGGYLVPRLDGRILVGATSEDVGFTKGVTKPAIDDLVESACRMAPTLAGLPVHDSWSGLRPLSTDSMPVIGSFSGLDGLMIATAHYRNGILLAPQTASIVADTVTGGTRSPLFDIFSPDRFRAAGTVT